VVEEVMAQETDPLRDAIAEAAATLPPDEGDTEVSTEPEVDLAEQEVSESEDDATEEVAAEADAEDEEPEIQEGEDAVEEGFISLRLPKAFQEQGIEEIEISAEHEDLFRALTNSYETKTEREEKEVGVKQYEAELMEELEQFRLIAATDPFRIVESSFTKPEQAEDAFRLWLLSDNERWSRFSGWVDEMDGQQDYEQAKRSLELDHRERMDVAKRHLQQAEAGKQVARTIMTKVEDVMSNIASDDRQFVRARLEDDIKAAVREQHSRTGSDIIDLEIVDKLAQPWLDRFGKRSSTQQPATTNGKQTDEIEAATRKIRIAAKRRQTARRTAPSSGQPASGWSPPKSGKPLDQVLSDLKRGRSG